MKEEWKDVKGLEGLYKVSNKGRVKSYIRTEHILKGNTSGHKYPRYNLAGKITYLHHIVAEAFIGERPNGLNVLHKDDNPLNNNIDNLYYGTQSNNIEDAIRNGNFCDGEQSGYAKLTEVQVCNIYVSGLSRYDLMKIYNVSYDTVMRIQSGKTWRYLFM